MQHLLTFSESRRVNARRQLWGPRLDSVDEAIPIDGECRNAKENVVRQDYV